MLTLSNKTVCSPKALACVPVLLDYYYYYYTYDSSYQ